MSQSDATFSPEEAPTKRLAAVPERTIARLHNLQTVARDAMERLVAMDGASPELLGTIGDLQHILELAEHASV